MWDRSWPSDQYPLVDELGHGFSVAFIPGRLSDHDLLDAKYVYRLRMMSGSLSAAMEQGCWCELQGAYFANWKASKMVIPYGDVSALCMEEASAATAPESVEAQCQESAGTVI